MADLDAKYQLALAALQSLQQQSQQAANDRDGIINNIGSIEIAMAQEQVHGYVDVGLVKSA